METFLSCAVISQNDTHRSLVVSLSYRSETLLPGSVPNLQFNVLTVNHDRLDFEVDSYKEKSLIILMNSLEENASLVSKRENFMKLSYYLWWIYEKR